MNTNSSAHKQFRAWVLVAIAALSLLALLTFDATGLSKKGSPDATANPVVRQDLAIAAQYWGVSPATIAATNKEDSYKVTVGVLKSKGPMAVAEAARPGGWMNISPIIWNDFRSTSADVRLACVVFVHEYGHSLGYRHVRDPKSVMNPEPREDSVPGCNAAFAKQAKKNLKVEAAQEEAAQQVYREKAALVPQPPARPCAKTHRGCQS